MVVDERARLAGLRFMLSGTPTISVVANAPAPLPAAASAQVSNSPAETHVSETPDATPVTASSVEYPSAATTTDPAVASSEALQASATAAPALPPRPLASAPLILASAPSRGNCPAVSDKGKGVDTYGDEAPTTMLSRKRLRVDTQDDYDAAQSLNNSSYHEFRLDAEVSASRQLTQPYIGRGSIVGAFILVLDHDNTGHHGSTEQTGVISVIHDSSGAVVTPARLSKAFDRSSFMPLNVLPGVYKLTYGCKLIPSDANIRDFWKKLTKIGGFGYWLMPLEGPDAATNAGRHVLQRSGPELAIMHQNFIGGLAYAGEQGMLVPAPLLCCFIVTLCCMRTSQLTGRIVSEMFQRVAGRGLESLRVVTRTEIRKHTDDELADMAKKWFKDLCLYISNGCRARYSLDMATKCFDAYTNRCRINGTECACIDPEGKVAQEMLASNEHDSQLVIGIQRRELRTLYKHMLFLVDEDEDRDTMTSLKKLSIYQHNQDR
ncbi:hypothetical protein GGI19_004137 [Coemansia pectinata]|uniref:Uncharacterized protein n=1 Tax=Coemansia pectinata TaxID=1052879 RepID=A0A9W8GWT9_9FUNG|nr:hypothetical protein GGI19_004137 [Coemansia pectinata]